MKARILIADDIAFVRQTIATVLSGAGHEIVGEASSGEQAVQMYERLRPDLVTLDVVMPETSGIEAARRIVKAHPEARILMISAMGQENLVMEAINAGACDYVPKPFHSSDLLKAIDKALRGLPSATPGSRSIGGPRP